MATGERGIKGSGLVFLWLTLVTLLWGVWRGTKRRVGSSTGRLPSKTRTPTFYDLVSLAYFSFCAWLWRPIAPHLSRPVRTLFAW